MKFLFSLALFIAAGVSAQETECDAQFIVDRCLVTEKAKVDACKPSDWDCLCAAHQAVATCWNNCPKDPSASPAQQQVTIMCQNASLYGTKAQASKTATVSGSQTSEAAAAATTDDNDDENTEETNTTASPSSPTQSADSPEGTGAAANIARNTGGLLLAVAGVVAAML